MRVIIIEDEELLANELEDTLLEIDSKIEVAAKLGSVSESVAWLRGNNCDLIFMDIQLMDGLSFAIFDQVDVSTPIIFTTAFDSYAIKAFEVNSIAYLLKPIEKSKLEQALDKFRRNSISDLSVQHLLTYLRDGLIVEKSYTQRFILTSGLSQKPVNADNIAYFMADNKFLFAVTDDGKKYFYNSTLAKLEEELNPHQFFRLNRKYYTNINSIAELIPYSKSRIKVKLKPAAEEDVIISYARVNEFKKWLKR